MTNRFSSKLTRKKKDRKMETKLNNTQYITKFYHSQLPDECFDAEIAAKKSKEHGKNYPARSWMKPEKVVKKILRLQKFKRTTTAKIFKMVDGTLDETVLAEGTVTCHPNDSYIKSHGRFFAFRDAIAKATVEDIKKNQTRMMESYVAQCSISQELFATIALESLRQK
jgi:hypothetical protein